MGISRFQFKDTDRPWTLEPVEFLDFNLLVGVSGAGKTRTLDRLAAVCAAGCGRETDLLSCGWDIEVDTAQGRFTWAAVFSAFPSTSIESDEVIFEIDSFRNSRFVGEVVLDEQENEIVVRKAGAIHLATGAPIRMKDQESVISLLRDEASIAPLYQALSRVHRSRARDDDWSILIERDDVRRFTEKLDSIEALRAASVPMALKAHALHERFRQEFDEIAEAYSEIFPSVGGLSVVQQVEERSPSRDRLEIVIEEAGVKGPIAWRELSAGMRRTLQHLFELVLAPAGTVLLIDEYENSMGVNCLEAVTDRLLEPTRGIQLIITSHHPYVINNVPVEYWRVVTREGSSVRVVHAKDIPALDTRSRQSAFIRLINAAEYVDGVR